MRISRRGLILFVILETVALSLVLAPRAIAGETNGQTQAQTTHDELTTRASRYMGFELEKVNQHFYLLKNGGAIEITAKDSNDKPTIAAIQRYLSTQAKAWEKGNFDTPTQIYSKSPDGVLVMRKMRDHITFQFVPSDDGGVLRMLTVNPNAKESVYEFTRFLIGQHHTGDPLQLE